MDVLDARQRIFQVRHPEPAQPRIYPTRSVTDVVQFFGRALQDADRHALKQFIMEQGMGPHDRECRAFDAAILLDPTTSEHRSVGEWSVTDVR